MKVQFFAQGEVSCTTKKVYCQLALDNEQRDTPFSLRITVPAKYWQPECTGQWVKEEYFLSEKINTQLKGVMTSFDDIINLLRLSDKNITYKSVRECFDISNLAMIQSKKKEAPLLLDIYDEMVKETRKQKQWRDRTHETYITRRSNIVAFLTERKLLKIKINEVRYKFFREFETWLIEKGLCRNYANKILVAAKKTLSYAVNEEYIEYMTVGKLGLTYDAPKPPSYLLPLYRHKIIAYDGAAHEQIRDVAVFLMYTGFSWVDYASLKEQHLVDGVGWKKSRNKSSIFSLPPLLPQAQKIISKYGGVEQLPQMHLDTFNEKIKLLGDEVGVTEELTGFVLSSSVFRDTFCSMMENERCADLRTVMAMMGHTNTKQVRNYSSVTPDRIRHELESQKGLKELEDL